MALPMDFWKSDQQLNVFRSKPCKRLMEKGCCTWESRCQFAHSLQTPRRPPQKHKYTAEICSEIRVTHGPNGEAQLSFGCLGQKCESAHSKEEVLWHPDIFKTMLCEAFPDQRKKNPGKNGKHNQCHRYYCPFAHGQQELRPSALGEDMRRHLIRRALDTFPSHNCCQVCVPHALPGGPIISVEDKMGVMPSNGNVPQQEVSSPPRYWQPANNQALALQDGQVDGKNQYSAAPYLQQQVPPNAQLMTMRQCQWVPSPDQPQFQMAAQGVISNEGCAMVVPGHQMPQEVAGQTANSPVPSQTPNASYSPPAAPGAQHPQQQMIPVVMSSPMGCGMGTPPAALPMVQLTPPIGQHQHNGGMGCMQMVPVTPVNTNAGHDNGATNSSEVVSKLLQSAGLERFVEIFKQNGLLELEPEAIASMQAEQLFMRPVEHKSLLEEIRGMQQKAQSGRGNMVMLPSSAPRTPNMPPQPVMVNSADMYGQWMAATSPGPLTNEGLQPYCYPQMGTPWGNSNGMAQQHPQMMQFVACVPGDQRSVQTTPQVVSPQDVQHVQFLPQIPLFPFPDQMQQQGQQAIQMQQNNMQNGAPCSPPQQQQRSNAMGPQTSPQQSFNSSQDWAGAPPAWTAQQQLPLPPPPLALNNGSPESQQSLRMNEESYKIADKESNGQARTKLKNRNQKLLKEPFFVRTVESLLENASPHILEMNELHKRLMNENIVFDSKLRQHLESATKFVVRNQHITLSKYLHCPEVKNLLDNDASR